MKLLKYSGKYNIEASIVSVSELEFGNRFDAGYYAPEYLRNEQVLDRFERTRLGEYLENGDCDYGISIAMNEDGRGFKILKMDNIIGVLASDIGCKYAEISENEFEKNRLKYGDVLFNRVNSEEFVGRTGIYLLDGTHTFASYLIRINTYNEIKNFFLAIFLNTKYGKTMLRRISRRAVNQANINSTELQSLRIPILSNEIQTEIHQMLLDSQKKKDDAAGLICQAEREVLSELDMINWCPSGKTIVIGETKFSIENNWSIRKLSDVLRVDRLDAEYWDTKYREIEDKINIYNSQQFTQLVNPTERTVKIKDSDDYVYVELSDINENTGMIERTNTYKGSELPSRARLQIKEGDILLSSVAGSINKVAIVREQYDNMLASTGFFTLREAEGKPLNKESILILLRILGKQYIVRESQGAILSAIPRKSLDRLFLPLLSGGTQFLVQKSVNEAFKSQEESQRLVNTAIKKLEDAIAQ